MKFNYEVTPIATRNLKELPNDWSLQDYRGVLDLTEMAGEAIADAELKEMTYMALSELKRPEAATIVLNYLAGQHLSEGQIQNAAHEMEDEKLWDEYADMEFHRMFFTAGSLLYRAFNGGFPRPEAMEIEFSVQPANAAGREALLAMDSALIMRLLAPGCDEHSLFHRLLEDQLKGTEFPEAAFILWDKKIIAESDKSITLRVISSNNWLEDFSVNETYSCTAWPDHSEKAA